MRISSVALLSLAAVTAQNLTNDASVAADLPQDFSPSVTPANRDLSESDLMVKPIALVGAPEMIEGEFLLADVSNTSNLNVDLAPARTPGNGKFQTSLTVATDKPTVSQAIDHSWLAQLVKAGTQNIPQLRDLHNSIALATNGDRTSELITPTVTLLNALLVVSTMLPVLTFGFFWLVRRLVVRELITDANRRLRHIYDLEDKLKNSQELASNFVSQLEFQVATVKQELELIHRELISSQSSSNQIEKVKGYILEHLESTLTEVENQKNQFVERISHVNSASQGGQAHVNQPSDNEFIAISNGVAKDFVQQGEAAFQAGRLERALVLFERAIEVDSTYYEAWYNRGNTLEKLQKHDEAIAIYQQAINLDANRYESWYNLGNLLFKLRRFTEALNCYEKVVAIQPHFYEIWYNQGIVFSRLQRHLDAAKAYYKAIEMNPGKYEAWYNCGNSLRRLQRYEEAIGCYNKALEIKSNKYEIWYNRGASQWMLGKYEEALTSYETAINLKDDDYEVWHNRGAVLEKLGRCEEAITSYDRAIYLKNDCFLAWFGKGEALQKLKRYQDALAIYEKAISLNPNSVECWRNKGTVFTELKEYKEAIASFDKAISMNPNDAEAWHYRGVVLSELKQFDAAINSMDQALVIQRNSRRQTQQSDEINQAENQPPNPIPDGQLPLPALWL